LPKILFLPTRYYPSISGAEFYIQSIAEILERDYKYKIDIMTSNAIDFKALKSSQGKIIQKGNKFFSKVNNLHIDRFSVDYESSLKEKMKFVKQNILQAKLKLSDECLKQLLKNGPFVKTLFDFIKNNQKDYDLIHTTFFPYFNLIIGLWLGKLLKKPVFCTPFFHYSNPRYLKPYIDEVLTKFDILIACTRSEKQYLIKNYNIPENKVVIIPMGVDFRKFDLKKDKQKISFKRSYFLEDETKFYMVLFCGYKNYEKGAISILKSIPYIIKKIPKVYFVFIGPSTIAFNRELAKLKKKFEVRIINLTPDNLKGYYDPKKIAAFNETDLFLMPSRSDAYGIAFLEAWASRKPVIGSKIGATPDVINDGIDGILVQFDDIEEISNAVIRLLNKKKLRKKLGQTGYRKIKKFNTWENIAKSTNKLYQEILKSNEI
jgi:glycosyltransferase involved in cell wall biosynthesis